MTDFASIRRRAEAMQERSGLGTPEHAISEDVLELLAAVKTAREIHDDCDIVVLNRLLAEATAERNEARELHAKVCYQLGEVSVIANNCKINHRCYLVDCKRPWPHEHQTGVGQAKPAHEPGPGGMKECRACGDVHAINWACDSLEVISQNGAFAGTVPHE